MFPFDTPTSVPPRAGNISARARGFAAFAGLLLLAIEAFPAAVRGDGLTITVENATATSGGRGSFDVVLTASGSLYQIAGFSVELSTPGSGGVTFTSASTGTVAPYIFGALQQAPLTFDSFPTTNFTASDTDMTEPGSVTLSAPPDMTVGMEHVTFSVQSGMPAGVVPVGVVIGDNTEILDSAGDPLSFGLIDGSITINASSVPEPMGLVSLVTGLLGVAVEIIRRRGRAALTSRSAP